jgi:DNA-binding MarR family transcriptional regulator
VTRRTAVPQRRVRAASAQSTEFRIGFLVHDVSRLRQTAFDQAMRPFGVTRAQWWALAQLTRHDPAGGMTQAELARVLGLGKVATGAMVMRLETAGLVSRRMDAADRRVIRVFVTDRGNRILERMIAVGRGLNDTLLRGLRREDLDAADRVLTELRSRLRDVLRAEEAADE